MNESQTMTPKITCHMIASVDGRLATDRWSFSGSEAARDVIHRVYDETASRLSGDGWMVGRKTMAEFVLNERVPAPLSPPVPRDAFKGKRGGRRLAIVLDRSGKLVYANHDLNGDHVVTILSERVEDAYLADLRRKGVSYLFAGPNGDDLEAAMAALCRLFGVREILLQGGGRINGAFLAAGLIAEFSTLIFPAIDGMHGIPAIVDYNSGATQSPANGFTLRLIANETLENGVVWLRHEVDRADVASRNA